MGWPKTFQDRSLVKKETPKVDPLTWKDGVLNLGILIVLSGFVRGGIGFWDDMMPKQDSAPKSIVAEVEQSDSPFDPSKGISTLVINGERWEVRPVAYGWFQGQTVCESRTIWLDLSAKISQENVRDVMWHEIQHAASKCQHKLSDEDANWVQDMKANGSDYPQHRVIEERAAFLTEFVHDNPEFMKWAEDWK